MPADLGPLVLIVDDNPRASHAVADLLTRSGYRVAVAVDGRSALELVAGELPAAVVMDPMGRSFDGFELAARLRAIGPDVRLVAVTGWRGSEVSRWLSEGGFDTVLLRPTSTEALLDTLQPFPPGEWLGLP